MTVDGVLSTVLYTFIGIALFIGAYYGLVFILRRKYDLHKELDDHNLSAGLAVGGLFVAIAIVLSGVIQ